MTRALIVVDVQNDFAHPDGNLYVSGGELVYRPINNLIEAAEYYGNPVIYTKDWHPPITGHFNEHGGPWPAHCVGETWGAEFFDKLRVVVNAPIVLKGTEPDEDGYSGFYVERDGDIAETKLHAILQEYEVTDVTVVGIALDVCVRATALDAQNLGYSTTVFENATAPVTQAGAREAVKQLREQGVKVF